MTARASARPAVRLCAESLEYPQMADESNLVPLARLVRWGTLATVLVLAVALYFVHGRDLPPLEPAPPAATAR